jgi:hypothetical protein
MENSDLGVEDVPARDADIRSEIEPLIEELLRYYTASSPEAPTDKDLDKTEMARDALDAGWELFDLLVGWAQSHMLGLEIASEETSVSKDFQRKFFRSRRGRLHAPEALGALFSYRDGTRDWPLMKRVIEWSEKYESQTTEAEGKAAKSNLPETQLASHAAVRRAIARILTGPSQLQWRGDLIRSFDRLEFGEIDEFLQRNVKGKWGEAYELYSLRKQVICFVNFEVGRGKKKDDVIVSFEEKDLSKAETIRHWEKQLKNHFSDRDDLECARLAGEIGNRFKCLSPEEIDDGSKYGFYENITRVKRAHHHYWKCINLDLAEIFSRYNEQLKFRKNNNLKSK